MHLNSTTTIRSILTDHMRQEGLNLNQFAQRVGLNAGSLSSILNGHRNLTIEQLDLMTESFGLHRGFFYSRYFEELIAESTPNWRRIKPFLIACAEVGNSEYFRKSIGLLLENLMYAQVLFEVAEDLYHNNNKKFAAIIYDEIAFGEKNQHSERLALCQYRLFLCKLEHDQEMNYQAAIQFELFVERLSEFDQLEALKDLANTYRSLRRWDKVEEVAEQLLRKAKHQYQRGARIKQENLPVKPLFTYVAYAYLLLGSVNESRQDYDQALQFIKLYENLNWVRENDETAIGWKEKFQSWAKMNTIVTQLAAGDSSVLPEYVSYMESHEAEIWLCLLNIVTAANRHNYNIDGILERIEYASLLHQSEYETDIYTRQTIDERIARCYYELAAYYLHRGAASQGFSHLMKALEKASLINEKSCIIKCVGLFENFRDNSNESIIETYKKLIREVYRNEK
ncbi:helix-turn-helix domain-containing protein [Paenibacillus sanguinis]|uniref:helix-turn-helix domain-containing protein n=1 Tax=Paenibacillus sanguinis TaxID=225906 RepID=UPI001F0A752D|nr:helix-turn-helix transcriptional regulator [Paenibacillus sanguinis]